LAPAATTLDSAAYASLATSTSLLALAPTVPALILTTTLLSLSTLLATAGGIGGGGFYVPILTVFASLDVHAAVPLSKALIFSSNLVVLLANWKVVDWEAAGMMQPASLAGTIVGECFRRCRACEARRKQV